MSTKNLYTVYHFLEICKAIIKKSTLMYMYFTTKVKLFSKKFNFYLDNRQDKS